VGGDFEVRSPDFALRSDAGSSDHLAKGNRNRVMAYPHEVTPIVVGPTAITPA